MKRLILILLLLLSISSPALARECVKGEFKIVPHVTIYKQGYEYYVNGYHTEWRMYATIGRSKWWVFWWQKVILPDVDYYYLDSIKAGVKSAEKYWENEYYECLRLSEEERND